MLQNYLHTHSYLKNSEQQEWCNQTLNKQPNCSEVPSLEAIS